MTRNNGPEGMNAVLISNRIGLSTVGGAAVYLLTAFIGSAFAAGEGAPHLNGADLQLLWIVPFVGILLSIALFPLVAPNIWHHNFGKISAFWALLFLIPFTIFYGFYLALF